MSWRTGIAVLSFFALIGVIQYPRVAETIREFTTPGTSIAAPAPEIAAPSLLTETPTTEIDNSLPVAVSDSDLTLEQMKLLVLDHINTDREVHGLEPVVLGDNQAAQMHADDMLTNRYLGHWWTDGRKPYMVYSETGGSSYVSENAAHTGFSEAEYEELCTASNVRCEKVDPVADIQRLHNAMVYDDAESDWRHRDNILMPGHRKVNIGIAYNDNFLSLVQHFEGGDVAAPRPPAFDASGTELRIKADLVDPDIAIFPTIQVHYEPAPEPQTIEDIEEFKTYCVGGGFTDECGARLVQIIPPPQPGSRYINLPDNMIVAKAWVISGGDIEVVADLGEFASAAGVYTTSMFSDAGEGRMDHLILQLSTVKE